jgi:hypothetical protein
MHSMTKMSPLELTLGKEARKPSPWDEKTIPKKLSKWSRGVRNCTPKLKSSWSRLKNGIKNMPIKHEGMWSLRLGNTCD